MPVVERASKTRGAPRYDASDIFLLNGQALIKCEADTDSPSCSSGGTHAFKTERYWRIIRRQHHRAMAALRAGLNKVPVRVTRPENKARAEEISMDIYNAAQSWGKRF